MNNLKKPIIVSIAFGLTTISAYAQSNVNLSGYTYGGIAFNSGGASTRTAMGAPASFMITSTEELGGGNRMILKWESGFSLKDGSLENPSSFWDKQAYIGMQGTWGTVRAGRLYTPAFATLALTVDPTETYGLFTSTNLVELNDVRLPSGIIYNTPGFNPWTYVSNGFYGTVAYYFGDSPSGGASKNSSKDFNVGYAEPGQYEIEFSGHRKNTYASGASDVNKTGYILGGYYIIGPAKLYLGYSWAHANDRFTNSKTVDDSDLILGASYRIQENQRITGSFINHNDKTSANNDAWQLGLGYEYFFSKRTRIMAAIAKIHNKNSTQHFKIANGYSGTTSATAGTQTIAIGLVRNF